jgi:hypothetical protein
MHGLDIAHSHDSILHFCKAPKICKQQIEFSRILQLCRLRNFVRRNFEKLEIPRNLKTPSEESATPQVAQFHTLPLCLHVRREGHA